jgi:hypothetical protein
MPFVNVICHPPLRHDVEGGCVGVEVDQHPNLVGCSSGARGSPYVIEVCQSPRVRARTTSTTSPPLAVRAMIFFLLPERSTRPRPPRRSTSATTAVIPCSFTSDALPDDRDRSRGAELARLAVGERGGWACQLTLPSPEWLKWHVYRVPPPCTAMAVTAASQPQRGHGGSMGECSHEHVVQPNEVVGPNVGPELVPTPATDGHFGASHAQHSRRSPAVTAPASSLAVWRLPARGGRAGLPLPV